MGFNQRRPRRVSSNAGFLNRRGEVLLRGIAGIRLEYFRNDLFIYECSSVYTRGAGVCYTENHIKVVYGDEH
jgi:hypothetical protein